MTGALRDARSLVLTAITTLGAGFVLTAVGSVLSLLTPVGAVRSSDR